MLLGLIVTATAITFLDSKSLIDSNLEKLSTEATDFKTSTISINDNGIDYYDDIPEEELEEFYFKIGDNGKIRDLYLIAKAQQEKIDLLELAVCKLDPLAEVCK